MGEFVPLKMMKIGRFMFDLTAMELLEDLSRNTDWRGQIYFLTQLIKGKLLLSQCRDERLGVVGWRVQ